MSKGTLLLSLLLLSLVIGIPPAQAQDEIPTAITDQNRTGDLPFSTVVGTNIEHVVVASGDLVVNIPIVHVRGRNGLDFDFGLHYDGRLLDLVQRGPSNTNIWVFEAHNYVESSGGIWQTNQPTLSYVSYSRTACFGGIDGSGTAHGQTGFILQDAQGTKHSLNTNWEGAECPDGSWSIANSGPDSGDEGFWATLSPQNTVSVKDASGMLFGSSGAVVTFPGQGAVSVLGGYTDANGNSTNNYPSGQDSLGRAIVTQTNGSNFVIYTVHASDGTVQDYTAHYSSIPIHTAFGYGQELITTRPALSSVSLPNGQSYSFAYDTYGSLTSLTLPTGAVITYTWANTAPGLNEYRYVASRTVTVNGVSSTWTFSGTGTETVTDPAQNQTVYSVSGGSLIISAKIYNGSATGTPLHQYTVYYTQFQDNSLLPTRITTQLDNGLVRETDYSYDTLDFPVTACVTGDLDCETFGPTTTTQETSRGNVKEIDEYDWGSGSHGPLLRKTVKSYLHESNSAYIGPNIVDKVLTSTVYDGAGNQVAQTQYAYDGATPTATSGAPQHDYTHFGSGFNVRGNATAVKRWRNTDGALLTTTYTYDDLGNIRTIVDPLNHTTQYDYTDSFANGFCLPPSNSQAYVSQVTNALTQHIQLVHYPCTGLVQASKDQNDINAGRAGTTFTYDLLNRLLTKTAPDTGQVSNTYNDTPPVSVTTASSITLSANLSSTAVKDGLGRVIETELTSDPQGTDFTATTYDALGRVASVSNPYRSTSDPTYGVTTYTYDALGRTTSVVKPDGSSSTVTTTYSGNCTTVTDEAGKNRESCTDGLGRMTSVIENPGGLGYTTNYTYDALDDLTGISQGGSRSRSFSYDSLKHLTSSTNPEPGTVTYAYDLDGNVATKTDARSITTTYTYDALNRVTGMTYSNSDPSVGYTYDQSACIGQPACYNIGHRTSVSDVGGGEEFAYDTMGREIAEQRTTSSVTKSTSYTYDLAGNMLTLTYPSGRTITYAYDSAGRPAEAADTANNINYVLGSCADGVDNDGVCYAPNGSVAQVQNGTNLVSTYIYNTRFQPCWMYGTTGTPLATNTTCTAGDPGPGNILDLQYNFNLGAGDNGNVVGITNKRDSTRTQSFTYDQLNRVVTAKTSATSGSNCWGETYTIDEWGNLTVIGAVSGYTGCTQESLSVSATTNNQLSATGFSYDTSGNMLNDGAHAYGYNAESEIKSAAGVNYTYDGDGNRIEKSSGKIYWYGAGTEILDESDTSGNITNEYVFFGGKRVAMRNASGTIYYYEDDMLGSARTMVQAGQTSPCYDGDFYPFGGERIITNTCTQNYKFEGKERDTETGNDDFGARYYSSRLGRWLSADWSAVPAPVPYANLSNPQTLNLYAMVSDNPETFADLDGHCPECVDLIEQLAEEAAESPEGQEIIGETEDVAQKAGSGIVTGLTFLASLLPAGDNPPPRQKGNIQQNKEKTQEAQPSSGGAGARKGGGRDARKSNPDRVKSAKDQIGKLKGQRDTLKSKANKTPQDKQTLDKLNRAIDRATDQIRKSESHSQKHKGQQQ